MVNSRSMQRPRPQREASRAVLRNMLGAFALAAALVIPLVVMLTLHGSAN